MKERKKDRQKEKRSRFIELTFNEHIAKQSKTGQPKKSKKCEH